MISSTRGIRITKKDLINAQDLDFADQDEPWVCYKVENGTIMKVKTVLKRAKKTSRTDLNGKPVYLIDTESVIRLSK